MSLAETHPDIAVQWHPDNEKGPEEYTAGSNFKAKWLCPNTCEYGCPHEWETTIASRVSGCGCPYCRKGPKKICIHQSLAFLRLDILKLWCDDNELDPYKISPSTNQRANLLCINCGCKRNNILINLVSHKNNPRLLCKKCGIYKATKSHFTPQFEESLQHKLPILAQQLYHPDPKTIYPGSAKLGTWNCLHECPNCLIQHQWIQLIDKRGCRGQCCSICYGNEVCPCGYILTPCEKEQFRKNWNTWKIECFGVEKVMEWTIRYYKRGSKIEWNLTDDTCKTMFQMDCFYCGQSDALNGIDRLDSSKGYTDENTVSCCSMCNYMKGPTEIIEFIKHVCKILEYDGQSVTYEPKKLQPLCFYKNNAKSRELKFELTKEQFHSLVSTSCHYCGTCQENGNGIDRVDNSKGYTMDNVVSCCSLCNIRIKQEWNWEVVLDHLRKIRTYRIHARTL
jgi:hypothetical protein